MDAVEPQRGDIKKIFPKMFQRLGDLGDEYHIHLKKGAVSYSLYTLKTVPIPLRSRFQDQLNQMENLGVITKVNEPTEWCAGIVVVPKKSMKVRICVDLKAVNDNILGEVHLIQKVNETLTQLAEATVFSKLDANSRFWQILLFKESKWLTTFVSPAECYCFNKLPFGISSAPELLQEKMNQILEDLAGTLGHMDDVLDGNSETARSCRYYS